MEQKKLQTHTIRYRLSVLLFSVLAVCLVLLSACDTNAKSSVSGSAPATAVPNPTVSASLKNQGEMQLQTLQTWITQFKQNGGDVTTYQQQYDADQQALQNATTQASYQKALSTLNSQVAAIQMPAMQAEAQHLQVQLQQQVAAWGQQHTYYNAFDKTTYPLGFEYGSNGIGSWVHDDLATNKTVADYQQSVEYLQTYLANFAAMTANSADKTPYNQPHQTDLQLMQHYNKMDKKVLVVSLEEQAMRVYDSGKLVNAFLVTTGRPILPTPPGVWWVESKQSPTVFKAGVPKSSPEWYPDTPINYAMQYHSNGYFIHDSWWRADYGPGTNYPHVDATGDPFSAQGSHGCINMSKANAGWVYGFVQLYTSIIVY